MDNNDISFQLNSLVNEYNFNMDTLSKYLSLDKHQINEMIKGNFDALPNDNMYRYQIFNKIYFLAAIPAGDKDIKLEAFLHVLLSSHNLSKATISKMSGTSVNDVDNILSQQAEMVSIENKYKIAVAVMALRFFLKDNENEV